MEPWLWNLQQCIWGGGGGLLMTAFSFKPAKALQYKLVPPNCLLPAINSALGIAVL